MNTRKIPSTQLGRRMLAVCLWLGFPVLSVGAQTLKGSVVDEGGLPVRGVIIQFLDSTVRAVARGLSNDRGEYRLTAPRAGTYRTSTLRIGFRPSLSEPVFLPLGGEITQRLTLNGVRVTLDAMKVEDRAVCRTFSDSAAATFAVWEQVRAALTATDVTARSRGITATTIDYDRVLDPNHDHVRSQQMVVRTAYVTQPWRALSPDSLHRFGYVIDQRDGSVRYYAPGLDMLLSPVFIEDHCFRLRPEKTRIGIAFEPVPDRKDAREIRGTLWLDRATSELKNIEFRFTGLPAEQAEAAGGEMSFARLRDGSWAVGVWNLRMPLMQQVFRPGAAGGTALHVAEIRSTGGQLALARAGRDTLWSLPPQTMRGLVRDSLSGRPIPSARVSLVGTSLSSTTNAKGEFVMSGVLPGEYEVEITTPSLDSVRALHRSALEFADASQSLEVRVPNGAQLQAALCGAVGLDKPGVIVGSVRVMRDTVPAKGQPVAVEWSETSLHEGNAKEIGAEIRNRWLETKTDASGMFRFCGVPVNTSLTVHAETGSGASNVANLRLGDNARFGRADITVDGSVARSSVLTGLVVDSTGKPMFAAEVSIPDASKTTTADARGAFRLNELLPGVHRVVVRRVGYSALEVTIMLEANRTIDRRLVLNRVVTLDSLVATASAIDPAMREFEENKKIGLGRFLTRDNLAKAGQTRLSSILASVTGLVVYPGPQDAQYTSAKRSPTCAPNDGQCARRQAGLLYDGVHCFALVYLDNQLLNPSHPAEPVDVNTFGVDQVEAIEFYSGGAETPAKYTSMGSNCGVLVLHTRRPSNSTR
ncbi:MAG: carboxypeptidase-like regulatory domain-containing protein [Gemmatimonadaceae bacterium]